MEKTPVFIGGEGLSAVTPSDKRKKKRTKRIEEEGLSEIKVTKND